MRLKLNVLSCCYCLPIRQPCWNMIKSRRYSDAAWLGSHRHYKWVLPIVSAQMFSPCHHFAVIQCSMGSASTQHFSRSYSPSLILARWDREGHKGHCLVSGTVLIIQYSENSRWDFISYSMCMGRVSCKFIRLRCAGLSALTQKSRAHLSYRPAWSS